MKKLLLFVFVCAALYGKSQASLCAGSSLTLTAGNPQSYPTPSYSLNPGGFSSATGSFVVSPNANTTYTLYTSPSGQAPATSSIVIQVTVTPQPLTNVQVIQPTCTQSLGGFNLNLTFNPSNVNPTYTVSWVGIPSGINSSTQTAVTPNPTLGVQSGTYAAIITAAGGCTTAVSFTVDPAPVPASFTINPNGSTQTITCNNPTITLAGSELAYTYTWNSGSTNPVISPTIALNATNQGTWSVTGMNPNSGCAKTLTFNVATALNTPTSTISHTIQNITCALSSIQIITVTAQPTINVVHNIYAPQGGVFSAYSHTATYFPVGVGIYTYCLQNLESGCQTCKTFTIQSNQGFPTFSLTSLESFTLGCNSRSVANVSIDDAKGIPPGSPVSYTLITPTSGAIQSGTLSAFSGYTVNTPGTYTAVVHDNGSGCETRTAFSILSNTAAPQLTVNTPYTILDCTHTTTVLKGESETKNVSYQWAFQGNPGTLAGSTVVVNINASVPTNTLINTYTLNITDNSSTCRSTSVVPMLQNTRPPNTAFAISSPVLTCAVPTVVLTNISTSNVPPLFNGPGVVVGYLWKGPTPQVPQQLSSTYVAGTYGTYTLTGKDLNNGCLSTTTGSIDDLRDYPILNNPTSPPQAIFDCAAASTTLSPIITTATNALTYTWTGPATASLSCANCKTLTTNFPGIFTITVTNSINACSRSATMSVLQGSLTAAFEADKETGYAPMTVQFFNNSSSSKSKDNITSIWAFGNGLTATPTGTIAMGQYSTSAGIQATVNPITVYTQPGTYSVVLFVSKGKCLDTMVKFIQVELPSTLEIPNVFTPNGDKVNDEYFIKGSNLTDLSMAIYDRWGHLVFEVNSSTGNVVWDGKNQYGVECAEGTYFYVIDGRGRDGVEYKKNGTIALLR